MRTNKRVFGILLITVLISMLLCGQTAWAAAYTVSGKITVGSLTGPALAGATVTIGGRTATTNYNGNYTVTAVSSGSQTMTVTKSGFLATPKSINVNGNLTGQNNFMTVSSYTVTATAGTGGTISPAGVMTAVPGSSKTFTITPNAGYVVASITVDNDDVTPSMSAPEKNVRAASTVRTFTLNNIQSNTNVRVSFKTTGYVVSGKVVTNAGTAIVGATVKLAGQTVLTNSTGVFRIAGISPGAYTLAASKTGYLSFSDSVKVGTNLTGFTLTLAAAPTYSVSGKVTSGSATGPAIVGATVGIAGKTATTNASGGYAIAGVLPGTYTMTVTKTGYVTTTKPVTIANANIAGVNVVLAAAPTYSVSGKVTSGSATGPAIVGATVDIAGKTVTTNASGGYAIAGVLPGTYTMTVTKTGYVTATKPVTVANANIAGVNVVMASASVGSAGMVKVDGGTFTRGDTFGEVPAMPDTLPARQVTVRSFFIGKYEVTFDEYDAFCTATGRAKPNDQGWGRGSRPVINVSWLDAIAYCNWRSQREGLQLAYTFNAVGTSATCNFLVNGYRLPTEAEWEYAAKGGTQSKGYKYSGSNDVNAVAWYLDNANNMTHPTGQKLANELGLYDMSGNVLELCWDLYDAQYYQSGSTNNPTGPASNANNARVMRGGSFGFSSFCARSYFRLFTSHCYGYPNLGFRIVRNP